MIKTNQEILIDDYQRTGLKVRILWYYESDKQSRTKLIDVEWLKYFVAEYYGNEIIEMYTISLHDEWGVTHIFDYETWWHHEMGDKTALEFLLWHRTKKN